MKTRFLLLLAALAATAFTTKAQFIVADPAHIAASIINTSNQIIQTSSTATNMINNFKEVQKVYTQGKEYYDALKAVKNLVKDAKKVQKTILLVGDISDIYVINFQKMLADENYKVDELSAIAFGYTKLLEDATDMLLELKDIVNVNGLSMSDGERMDIINSVYERLRHQRDLVNYYTKKNISVSYLRAKKKNDSDRVIKLYGTAEEKYW